MSGQVTYYLAAFAIILTHSTIVSVTGQCTVQGCENEDPSMSIVTEIQQLRVELFDHVNKQVQNIQDLLIASFQQMTNQHDSLTRSLQAVDRRPEDHDICIKQVQSINDFLNESFQEMRSEHDTAMTRLQEADRRRLQEHAIYIKQGQSINDFLNESFQEMRSEHDTAMTRLQEADRRRLQEHEICIKQGQSINDFLNESFQEMKNQHDTAMTRLQEADRRRLQEHEICIKQGQRIHELLNESFQELKSQHVTIITSLQAVDRRPEEHDICIKQVQSIHEILNESVQQQQNQHDTVVISLQEVDRRSQEHNMYIKQVQSIHELLNETFQEMKSQHGTIMTRLEAVDRRLQEHDISISNKSVNAWKLANGSCSPASDVCDCSDIKASGQTTSGVYEVCVAHQLNRTCTYAYCDMDTNNGTSLVFQRRKDGSVNFNRTWADYKEGFGNRNGEFWLGNEMLHLLTTKRNYKLRVELEDFHGNKSFAEYTIFFIISSRYNYTLVVGGYSGTASDSLSYSSGNQFSTDDVDNDDFYLNCARTYGGAWWHHAQCSYVTLNGKYYHRYDTVNYRTGIHWLHWHGNMYISLKATEMKLVPVA